MLRKVELPGGAVVSACTAAVVDAPPNEVTPGAGLTFRVTGVENTFDATFTVAAGAPEVVPETDTDVDPPGITVTCAGAPLEAVVDVDPVVVVATVVVVVATVLVSVVVLVVLVVVVPYWSSAATTFVPGMVFVDTTTFFAGLLTMCRYVRVTFTANPPLSVIAYPNPPTAARPITKAAVSRAAR
jgi:hypothetical protein